MAAYSFSSSSLLCSSVKTSVIEIVIIFYEFQDDVIIALH